MPAESEGSLVRQASTLIEERTGLAASTRFRSDLDTILRNLSGGNLDDYVRKLRDSSETEAIWQSLINALTIGETYFFRDVAHFRLLKSHILPGLVFQRRQQNQTALNIWSVGCATGEETYSIAITLQEFLPDLPIWTVRLIGTDINARALQIARQGTYRRWAFRLPPASESSFQQRYFDQKESGTQIKPYLREMVNFRSANVLDGPPLPQLDIIFCRNVLIYFHSEQARMVENILYDALAPGGWLILGQSEAVRYQRERWITHLFPGSPVYQKPLQKPALQNGELSYRQHTTPALEITQTDEVPVVRISTYDDAVRALQNDSPDDAQTHLAELLTYQPDHAPAHVLLASIFANRRAVPEAHARLDTALRIDPLLGDGHYLRAILFLEEGRAEAAKRSLQAALYCQRNHPLASFMLGNLYAQEGEIARANRAWQNARQAISSLKPDSPISDMSDMTAGTLQALINSQLDGWES